MVFQKQLKFFVLHWERFPKMLENSIIEIFEKYNNITKKKNNFLILLNLKLYLTLFL